jgi:hypothetical protein
MRFPRNIWLLLLTSALCARPDETAAPTAVTSASSRFRSLGEVAEHNLTLVAWADRFAGQLEEWVGRPLPWAGAEMILFRCRSAPPESPARVSARFTPGGVAVAEVEILGFLEIDQEDLQEEVARLLLTRLIGARPPDWFAVGVAQACHAGTRERNLTFVMENWQQNKEDRVRAVLGLDTLPRGRWGSKASATAVCTWLASQPGRDGLQAALFSLWRAGGRATPDWLLGRVPGTREDNDLEKSFDLWLLGRSRDPATGHSPQAALARLREALQPAPMYLRGDSATGLSLERMPLLAGEPWLRAALQDMNRRLGLLQTGQPADFLPVAAAYQDWIAEILRRVPADPAAGPRELPLAEESALLTRLRRARALQHAYEERLAMRLAWLDELHRRLDPPPPPPAPPAERRRTVFQLYLDAFDDERQP